jgi:hypothetical protein
MGSSEFPASGRSTEDYKKFVTEVTEFERKVIDTLGLAKKTN